MSTFIKNPNLPDKKVTLCAVSSEAEDIIFALHKLNIKVHRVNPISELDSPVASHADMQLHHLGNNMILAAKENLKQIKDLSDLGFNIKIIENLNNAYPKDCLLNAARIGKYCICNQKNISRLLLNFLTESDIKIINTAQGYAKCSTCVIDDKSIITSDLSIARVAYKNNISVLVISPGGIDIPKYQSGFIGGCCGKISNDVLAFTGDISKHTDYKNIKQFIEMRKIEIICLTKKNLFDIGGILALKEKELEKE